jgi:undecaprenyl pyrophosphate synthase
MLILAGHPRIIVDANKRQAKNKILKRIALSYFFLITITSVRKNKIIPAGIEIVPKIMAPTIE